MKLKLVEVDKFCSSDVSLLEHGCLQETLIQQFPWKRKELERPVPFVSRGRKGKGYLSRKGVLSSHLEFT